MGIIKEFFGFGGYDRPAEGYLSWQHLVFVTSFMVLMVVMAIIIGSRQRNKTEKEKNKILAIAAITIDSLEIIRIVLVSIRSEDPMKWVYLLPLFLCSIQLITIPLAAFSRGRVKEAALDFVFIFGILGATLGTYGAGNDYSCFPIFSYDIIHTTLTHTISGFCSLYILFSGMISMKRRNIPIGICIVSVFCVLSYIVNCIVDYNYMFLMRGDGTPYDIVFNLCGGNPVIYPIVVVLLFYLYIAAFYLVYYLITERLMKKRAEQ